MLRVSITFCHHTQTLRVSLINPLSWYRNTPLAHYSVTYIRYMPKLRIPILHISTLPVSITRLCHTLLNRFTVPHHRNTHPSHFYVMHLHNAFFTHVVVTCFHHALSSHADVTRFTHALLSHTMVTFLCIILP